MEESNKTKELVRAIGQNAPKSENEKEISGMKEFKEALERGLLGWNSSDKILEEQVGDCIEMAIANSKNSNEIMPYGGSRLGNRQYKLPHRDDRYIVEKELRIL